MLIEGLHLGKTVRMQDDLVLEVLADVEGIRRADVRAEVNLARELFADVVVVTRDHLDGHVSSLDLGDGLPGVMPRWVHDRQDACKLCWTVVHLDHNPQGLEAGDAKRRIRLVDFLADRRVILNLPLVNTLITGICLENDVDHALGTEVFVVVRTSDGRGCALDNGVEAAKAIRLKHKLLLSLLDRLLHTRRTDRLHVSPEHGRIDGIVLVGRVGCN
mmetsp:Transcript_26507/g.72783  ORF Transcript_26507/g.72783 Transcript_26507/m.72783 type:complete len:217 (+) Transcript_26507:1079-1729(+)